MKMFPAPAAMTETTQPSAHALRGAASVEQLDTQWPGQPDVVMDHLGKLFRIPTLSYSNMASCAAAFDVVPYTEATRRRCIALRSPTGNLWLVLGDPYDAATQDWIEERVTQPFEYRIAHHADVTAWLASQEGALRAMDGMDESSTGNAGGRERNDSQDISIASIADSDSPVIRLVNSTLHDALKAGASDIHLETTDTGLTIKYRVDGALARIKSMEGIDFADQSISRIKVMAELDIAERRVPQDGRFRARNGSHDVDFRVSIMPSAFGEDAVLRILDKRTLEDQDSGLSLAQLGLEAELIRKLRRLSSEPYGMLLVTGPTGSGKTTTLYSVISEVNSGLDKIITIEDPVEYRLPGVLQIPVNEKKGLTFARGLRSILRHDPDRIMVGEIRDAETAEIAVQSALTGHLVYTTVHANNVFDVIGRFMHMGVDTFNLASALNAVMAQRLVRMNCRDCAEPDQPDAQLLEDSGLTPDAARSFTFRRGKGCAACRGTGYRGRKAIAELMILNDELRGLLVARAPTAQLKARARALGTRSLREAALDLVRHGETTLEEINRATTVAG